MDARQAEEREEFLNDAVTGIFNLLDHPTNGSQALTRLYQCLLENEDVKIYKKINETTHTEDKQYAAVKLFSLHDKLAYRKNVADSHNDLINAISDSQLTLDYANRIFIIYKVMPSLTMTGDRLFGSYRTKAWQETMGKIRQLADIKLIGEVNALTDKADKLALLSKARDMPIFNEHQSNFLITGAWGRTSSVSKIDYHIHVLNTFPEGSRIFPS